MLVVVDFSGGYPFLVVAELGVVFGNAAEVPAGRPAVGRVDVLGDVRDWCRPVGRVSRCLKESEISGLRLVFVVLEVGRILRMRNAAACFGYGPVALCPVAADLYLAYVTLAVDARSA